MTETGETVVKIQELQKENTRLTYTPKIISIGPLHNGKRELQPMEDLKKKYLEKLLNRSQNSELLKELTQEATNMEVEVRGHYKLPKIISIEGFVKILVKDGCFLLEFLSKKTSDDLGWLERQQIDHDILLFENQIPFFVLKRFYHILRENGINSNADPNLEEVAYHYLNDMNKVTNNRTFLLINETHENSNPFNLLHLYHMMLFSENHQPQHPTSTFFWRLFSFIPYILYLIHKFFFADNSHIMYSTSATEIEEAGVRFQGSRMELRFEEGTLLIPPLALNQQSLSLLKNLMAFEFYFPSDRVTSYVHAYLSFLTILIKNPGDLKVMEKHHVIMSGGGDESFKLVGDLLQAEIFTSQKLPQAEIFTSQKLPSDWQSSLELIDVLQKYCQDPRHRWYAKQIRDYFGKPWKITAVLFGVSLLVLTIVQTVLNLLNYLHRKIGR